MSVQSSQVSVSDTAPIELVSVVERTASVFLLLNSGSGNIMLGGSNVTASEGYPANNLPTVPGANSGTVVEFSLNPGDSLYAIAQTGTGPYTVGVLVFGL